MNNSNRDLLGVLIELVVLVLTGIAGVCCIFLLLNLVRSMVV